MANSPSYYRTFAPVTSLVQHQEHRFQLYLHESNDVNKHLPIVVPQQTNPHNAFGITSVMDWDVLDRPEIGETVIGRLQGLQISAAGLNCGSRNRFLSSNLVFTDSRFKGSTLSVQGRLGFTFDNDEGDWAVVGGTGEFACAQGTVAYKQIRNCQPPGRIIELKIRVICLTFPKPTPVKKVGPWGGSGGTAYEIQDDDKLPKRLESVKIYADDNAVQSIAFSYVDQAGHNHTVGPWHRDDGMPEHPPIPHHASETVKEIYGETGNYGGHTVVTSLTIVTNRGKYGPYGKNSPGGDTPFQALAPENHSIVGFYGRLGQVVDQIGAYVRHDDD